MFFALWPDDEVRRALATLARDCVLRTGGRAPDAANLHLTMAFIGDASASDVAMLREIGASVAASSLPFTLTLDRIGAFRRQEIAWVGSTRKNPPIEALADRLSAALAAGGFELESRPFHPHVTLARRARKLDSVEDGAWAPIVWDVARLTLAASKHAQGALRYDPVDAWPLCGGRRES